MPTNARVALRMGSTSELGRQGDVNRVLYKRCTSLLDRVRMLLNHNEIKDVKYSTSAGDM